MANGENLDVNSMYSILKDIFNREYNENYTNRNRSAFAGGLADLRNGWAAMQNARKNKKDQAEYKNSMSNGGGNQYPNGSIGATGDGIYGVNSMPPQPNGGGIGVDANGVYGVNGATPQPNQFKIDGGGGFDWSKVGQMPTENSVMNAWGNQGGNPTFGGNGGFDWGKASPMPNGNSVMDAWGKQGGNSMFSGNSEKPDNTMNITSQTIGNNYNGRIDGQVGGLGIPQSPQGGGGFSAVFNGANANPYQPSVSSSDVAQRIGGQGNVSANDLSQYLGNEYNRARWIQDDMANNGVTNPLISMLRYDTKIAPLVNAAKEDELRNAFFVLQNPKSSDQDKMNAIALIQYRKGDPYLEENQQMKRDKAMYDMGYLPEGDFGYGSDGNSGGSGFVNKVRDLQGKIGYNAPDGTNCMRTLGIALQGTPYEGQINVDQAINTAKEHGDLHVSGDGYVPRAGDIAVVNDGNHAVMLTENGGTIQNGQSHNGVYEDPRSPEEMFGGVNYWISSSRYGRGRQGYRRDPYRVSPREQFNYNQQRDAMNYALRNRAIDARLAAKTGNVNSNFEKNNVGVREAAMNLAGLQDISPDNEKGIQDYEKGMKDFTKQIGALYDAYGLNGNKMDSTQLGIALYHKLNETRSGLRPETLAEGVARAIYLKRGDVDAEDLQRAILAEVYGNNGQQGGTQAESNSKNGRKDPVDDLNYEDRRSGGYNIDGVSMSEEMYNNIKSIKPYEKTVKDSKERFAAEAEAAENRRRANEEEQIRLYDELEKNFGI